MKSFYPVLYLCFLFGLLPFLGSCSEENESSGTIEMNQLPGTAQSFLSNYFPGQTPEKIERTNTDQENAPLLYRVVFPNEVKVEFSENGGWKRLMIPDQKLPGSLDSLWGKIIEYVQQLFPDDPFIGIENACYGDCVLLSSGKKIAFHYDGTCIGYEMDIKDESGGRNLYVILLQRIFRMEFSRRWWSTFRMRMLLPAIHSGWRMDLNVC